MVYEHFYALQAFCEFAHLMKIFDELTGSYLAHFITGERSCTVCPSTLMLKYEQKGTISSNYLLSL